MTLKPEDLPAVVAGLLESAGHPDVAAVTALATPTVRIDRADGGKAFIKVAHVQPADRRTPERPTWPGHAQAVTR